MNCSESEILIHALIDGELDAGHTRDVEAHVTTCPDCAGKLEAFRAMRQAMAEANLKEAASAHLRSRIEAAVPSPRPSLAAWFTSRFASWGASRLTFFGGFGLGTALSAAIAASLVITVIHDSQEQMITGGIVSAHLRSLRPGHLTDVETSDQHTVKPWFNGKLDVAPPVIDLAAQGFTLIGGRLDYIDGEAAASIVYRRANHVINLFVSRHLDAGHGGALVETKDGFNVRHWTEEGLDFWAISDINAGELEEFCQKFTTALHSPPGPS